MNRFVTVTWRQWTAFDEWHALADGRALITNRMHGKIGKHIRVLAVGKKNNTPHVHYVMTEKGAAELVKAARSLFPKVRIFNDEIYFIEGSIGYLFDENYLPTALRDDRPKGFRLMIGSRGLKYGYPLTKDWDAYRATLLL